MAAADAEGRRWLVLRVKSPSEESIPWLAEGLVACGANAVQELEDAIVTWFPAPEDPDAFTARVAAELQSWNDGRPVRLERDWRADEDWSRTWRAGLAPRRIGRIVVTPTWCVPEAQDGELVIVIDPQMAFGTGEHASTRGVLRLLQGVAQPGDVVLDIGTGSAVLAIAAALLGARRVTAVDNDADALVNARENIDHNGCTETVALERATVDAAWLREHDNGYSLILANVLSGVLVPLLPGFRAALCGGGHAILSGILSREAGGVRAAAAAAGFRVAAEDTELEWWSVVLAAPGHDG